ncbi:MAG: hypothetical protein R2873_07230 [Caldilineaceae bacterium]
MYTISSTEFMNLVSMRRRGMKAQEEASRQKVLRLDQLLHTGKQALRRLATCPTCDAVVAADILHPGSGLCPRCHAESKCGH